MKTLIIWDWDNTLADTKEAVRLGLNDTMKHYGFPEVTKSDVVNVMGSHRGHFWQVRFHDEIPQAIAYYVSCYRKHSPAVRLFEDSLDILNFIRQKNIPQVLVSNKEIHALKDEVKDKGVYDYFDEILGTTSPLGKPEKAYVQPILDKYQPQQIILIGDGQSDMLTAQNIGAVGILVRQFNADLPHDYFFETLKEVQAFLSSDLIKD